jgi:hypothetical protein
MNESLNDNNQIELKPARRFEVPKFEDMED